MARMDNTPQHGHLPYVRCELRYFLSETEDALEVTKQRNMAKEGKPPSAPTTSPKWNETMTWPLKPPRGTDHSSGPLGWTDAEVLKYYRQAELHVQVMNVE